MDTPEAKNLIELLTGRSTAWNSLWTMLYTVSAAMIGIVSSGKITVHPDSTAAFIIAIGFLVFAAGNYLALNGIRKQREAIVAFV